MMRKAEAAPSSRILFTILAFLLLGVLLVTLGAILSRTAIDQCAVEVPEGEECPPEAIQESSISKTKRFMDVCRNEEDKALNVIDCGKRVFSLVS